MSRSRNSDNTDVVGFCFGNLYLISTALALAAGIYLVASIPDEPSAAKQIKHIAKLAHPLNCTVQDLKHFICVGEEIQRAIHLAELKNLVKDYLASLDYSDQKTAGVLLIGLCWLVGPIGLGLALGSAGLAIGIVVALGVALFESCSEPLQSLLTSLRESLTNLSTAPTQLRQGVSSLAQYCSQLLPQNHRTQLIDEIVPDVSQDTASNTDTPTTDNATVININNDNIPASLSTPSLLSEPTERAQAWRRRTM